MPASPPRRYAMVVDLRRCTGCQACSVACKAEHRVPLGTAFTWVKAVEQGRFPATRHLSLPTLCNHCERPSCVDGCPVGASYVDEGGIVRVDPHRCVACKYCFWACPYGVRIFDPDYGVCRKCDFCAHRVAAGVSPACVAACPSGALAFGDLAAPDSPLRRVLDAEAHVTLRPESGNGPQVYYLGAAPGLTLPWRPRRALGGGSHAG